MIDVAAAVLRTSPGQPELTTVALDEPGPFEVLVRLAAAGLCHSDLHHIRGTVGVATPTVLGHEGAGVVEHVGSHVTTVQPGDHVVVCLSTACGSCEFCVRGSPSLCESAAVQRQPTDRPRISENGQRVHQYFHTSTFAEAMLFHESAVVAIPREAPLDVVATLGCAVTTGMGSVIHTAEVRPGQDVAVIGCGGIGLSAVQAARLVGARRIIAVDTSPDKLEAARTFGATHVVQATRDDAADAVRAASRDGVDHVIEAVGGTATVALGYSMLRRGGTLTVVGLLPDGSELCFPSAGMISEFRVQGSRMGSNRFRLDVPFYVELYLQGRLKLDELLTSRLRLDQLNEGFEQLAAGGVNRAIVDFSL